ncbi:ABC-type transporter cicA [Aduncisulcus paluster]|uniref:ABC-type transporter cicA n=2 Tax=Aduncisulcus paluster TaxID=2918883 RepID=A0ABQ5KKG0_9EUKA|nr:ABC-type transporter cicA [Aduncisulcus paluster]
MKVVSVFTVVGIAIPWYLISLVPLGALYLWIYNRYRNTQREVKRWESVTSAPIVALAGEAVAGLATIRAFNDQDRFVTKCANNLDKNNKAYHMLVEMNRWSAFRLETIATSSQTVVAALLVTLASNLSPSIAALCLSYSLSITQTLNWVVRQLTEMEVQMNSVERVMEYAEDIPEESGVWNEEELERKNAKIQHKRKEIDKENAKLSKTHDKKLASWEKSNKKEKKQWEATVAGTPTASACYVPTNPRPSLSFASLPQLDAALYHPDQFWPSESPSLVLSHVYMRYRPELPLVLHDISVDIKGGEKIGVVGRSGSGKSSLVATLLRLVDIDHDAASVGQHPSIRIDEVDIHSIGLHRLRHSVAYIPQDPVLFAGSIRRNLAPTQKDAATDDEMVRVLSEAGLLSILLRMVKERVSKDNESLKEVDTDSVSQAVEDIIQVERESGSISSIPNDILDIAANALQLELTDGGANLSVGQRQLVCLCRALLRSSSLLLMDEATSSIDRASDAALQRCVYERYKKGTVITIAHRLDTVMGYDKILVMDAGRVGEYGSPAELLAQDGLLSALVKETGEENEQKLREMAGLK